MKKQKDAGSSTVSMNSLFDISNRHRGPELAADMAFLTDQRSERRLQIGSLDRNTSAFWQRRAERVAQEAKLLTKSHTTDSQLASVTTMTGSSATAVSPVALSSRTASYSGCNGHWAMQMGIEYSS